MLDASDHLHEDDLELYARGRLEPELVQRAENHLLACEICQKVLADCLWRGIALRLPHVINSDGPLKRVEPRFVTEGEALLQEIHPLSTERHKVQIVDVSKNGLGLSSPKAILPGTIVQLRIKDSVELGNVRYCSPCGDAFKIGVRLRGEG